MLKELGLISLDSQPSVASATTRIPRLASGYTDCSTTMQPPLTYHKVRIGVECYGSKGAKAKEHVDESPRFEPDRTGTTGEIRKPLTFGDAI